MLARHLSELLHQRLADEQDADRRLAFAKKLLVNINEDAPTFAEPVRQLHAVRNLPAPGQAARYQGRPKTPLNDAALLTNAHGEPSLAAELKAEIESADRIDLLCAFVMWRGLRLLEPNSRARERRCATASGDHDIHRRHREGSALDRLSATSAPKCGLQYDAARTRLHAKAWLFRRNTGFDTAYVGSSNLSTSALLDGVEWNVRLSKKRLRHCSRSSRPPSTHTGTARSSSRMTQNAIAIGSTTRWR